MAPTNINDYTAVQLLEKDGKAIFIDHLIVYCAVSEKRLFNVP